MKKEEQEQFNFDTGAPVALSSIPVIENEIGFKESLKEIDNLMVKGDDNLSPEETYQLRLLALAVRNFDRNHNYSLRR